MADSPRSTELARERIAQRKAKEHPPSPVDNPLDTVIPTGDIEADKQAEASAILTAFRQRANDEKARIKLATDSEFWFAVCFVTREQKDTFLAAMGWNLIGDKYLDGELLALMLDIELPPRPKSVHARTKKTDKRLNELTEDYGDG